MSLNETVQKVVRFQNMGIIQFRSSLTIIYGMCTQLYMEIMPIYGRWQNVLSADFSSPSVLNQS